MTANTFTAQAVLGKAGAPSRPEDLWLQIDWRRVEIEVKQLQVRIAKATKAGRWGKVKALQRLLSRSHFGKLLAVRRVTDNRGRRTPGVDGVIWNSPAAKWKGVQGMRHRGYRAMPLRRIHIPKSNGKKRPLGIPRMLCRAMQALWKLALEPIAETLADPNSYGFRTGRSTSDAISYCFNTLAKRNSPKWVIEGDIKGCFDNISHGWILDHIAMDKAILQRWLKAGFIEKGELFATTAGTPQGGIISPVIANMTLDGLESAIFASVGPTASARRKFKINVIRYADDFIVTGASKEVLANEVLPAIRRFLADRGLELSEEKTRITRIDEGFDFLGQNIRKYKDKLLIKPSNRSSKALMEKVREVVKRNSSATQLNLIRQLNPVIRGWATYHRHVVSKDCFSRIDALIWCLLWRWAKRRHPNKGAGWVKKKYFHVEGAQNWVFASRNEAKEDSPMVSLFRAMTIPIIRHVKIRSLANPFDPEWFSYFDARQASQNIGESPGASIRRWSMA